MSLGSDRRPASKADRDTPELLVLRYSIDDVSKPETRASCTPDKEGGVEGGSPVCVQI